MAKAPVIVVEVRQVRRRRLVAFERTLVHTTRFDFGVDLPLAQVAALLDGEAGDG